MTEPEKVMHAGGGRALPGEIPGEEERRNSMTCATSTPVTTSTVQVLPQSAGVIYHAQGVTVIVRPYRISTPDLDKLAAELEQAYSDGETPEGDP